jgi:hypothetical protein
MLQSELPTATSSYEARILNRGGIRNRDPNIYVYTPAFGQRFQMPVQWESKALQGADAVAFRVMPTYASCGWGGDRQACREDEVRCVLDVYFDQQRNPLPWDPRMSPVELDRRQTSLAFMTNLANPPVRPRTKLPGAGVREPLTDPQTGKELGWMYWDKSGSSGWTGIISYDKNIFSQISMITIGTSCYQAPGELWLTTEVLNRSEVPNSPQLKHRVILPENWQQQVKQAMAASEQRSRAFYREQGEKALKALQTNPAQPVPFFPPVAPAQTGDKPPNELA